MNMIKRLAVFGALLLLPGLAIAGHSRDSVIDSKMIGTKKDVKDPTETDGKAFVYEVKGKSFLIKKGNPIEKKIQKGDIISKGDTVRTEAKSQVSISFDKLMKNAVEIPADSKAVFASIEPTDIHLENGTIFSAVDGLPQGSSWKVTTPSAVAAVRGTLYIVRFQTASGEFFAATVNVPDDGKTSEIEIKQIDGDGSAEIPEGREIVLHQGEAPSDDLIKDFNEDQWAEIQNFFQNLAEKRDEADKSDDATGDGNGNGNGEDKIIEDDTDDSFGDNLGDNQPDLEPTETNSVNDEPAAPVVVEEEKSPPEEEFYYD